ncbi:MAG: family 16 glycosylhydrolase [Candidatus Eisenbacteria bacterium]|uniref:Family 16 glycosylhydrolase n=1 Tax=Eiseniibacteriota bacterium TaxID=2212470 RepID=A0A7Y2H0Q4_UNCEI|nr:family 16 glycosylhydrolase [Candidatus Eisenbacteria bacterium]
MNRFQHPWILLGLTLVLATFSLQKDALAQGYQLVWADEFDGSSVDLSKWTFEIGDGCPSLCGWGNNELQYYKSENTTLSGGLMTITAKFEPTAGRLYTSSRLVTKNKFDFTYGRIEMRAQMPEGQGLWPAFWLLFTDPSNYGGWAAGGELDIMEYLGHDTDLVYGTIHYGAPSPGNVFSGDTYELPSGNFSDSFHTFAVEWEPGELRWYVDGIHYMTRYEWFSTGGAYPAPFDHDFHILLNCAVGGDFPGNPDGTTMFPQDFVIDYVRVYQKPEFEDCSVVFAGMDPFEPNWFVFQGAGGGNISSNTTNTAPIKGYEGALNCNWGSATGYMGGFGRENIRDLTDFTHFNFWIDPAPGESYQIQVQLQDDDNGDDIIPAPDGNDDEFQFNVEVNPTGHAIPGGGWQRVSIPLSSFFDDNSYHYGGNGILDLTPTSAGGNGQLIFVVITLIGNGTPVNFVTDRWEFTREDGVVSGELYSDTDGNGMKNGVESGIDGVEVRLFDSNGTQVGTTNTAGGGLYSFGTLPGDEYRVEIDDTNLALDGTTPTEDPDGVVTPHEAYVPVDCSATLANQDFGYEPASLSVPDGTIGAGLLLRAAVPNPFSSSTNIAFSTESEGLIKLTVFDLNGRVVANLVDQTLFAGDHEARWNGRDLSGRQTASGIYLVALQNAEGTATQRVVRFR